MTSRDQIQQTINATYAARKQGNLDETMKSFADDATFLLNAKGIGVAGLGEPISGKPAIRSVIGKLIEDWRFNTWDCLNLVVEGEKVLVHWRANVTFVPTSKSAVFDVFDVMTFRDGQIVEFRQSTDTAQMMRLAS